ncbi:3-hydroxyacyl-ACP dehydratase FabZ family protein [Longispora albida]|uniref:3-hydroxyacyl-ACP dehydratase FabZ family protein n=1 Tax=Longispora albida TaxID=203523 RepID=UPI00036DF2E9|nr:hypothetical protein [Longispora albida]
MMLGAEEIQRIIPHRPPMLLVDAVTACEPGKWLTAELTVRGEAPLPGSLLIESWAQAALLLIMRDAPSPDVLAGMVPVAGALEGIRFGRPVRPGETVEHRINLLRLRGGTAFIQGGSRVGGDTVLDIDRIVAGLRPASVLRTVEENQ